MKREGENGWSTGRDGACPCPDCRLPPQGPPAHLRDKAVAIWCRNILRRAGDGDGPGGGGGVRIGIRLWL